MRNFYLKKFSLGFFLLACFFCLIGNGSATAQTTETFESATSDAKSFTSNGQLFNITTDIPSMPWAFFHIYGNTPNLGWNGTAKDNKFIDNSGGPLAEPNAKNGVTVNFSIATQGAVPFQVKSLWIYPARYNASLAATGSVTFTGSLNGVTQFTATSSSGFNTNSSVANGFTLVDFTTYGGANNASTNIDKLTISTGGQYEYIAIDAFKWSAVSPAITADPTNVAICEGGTATFNVTATNATAYKWQVSTTGSTGTYTDVSDGGVYSNATTSSLTITNPAKTLTNAFYRCVAINGGQQAVSTGASLTFSASWTGAVNSNWSVAGNWSCNKVPTDSVDVIINATANNPVIGVGALGTVRNLNIASGASLSLFQGGSMVIDGHVTNLGTFDPSATGTRVTFKGGNREQYIPAATYNEIVAAGGVKRLAGGVTINGTFYFGGGKIYLGANSMVIGPSAIVSGANSVRYFVTNGTGSLKKMGLGSSSFVYPIGTNSSYTPMLLSNSGGTVDNYSARIIDGVYNNYIGTTPVGAPITSRAVNKTWFLAEDVAGGSNLQYIVQWNQSDELSGFARSNSFLSQYSSNVWDSGTLMSASNASGPGPYLWTRNGLTSLGAFGLFSSPAVTGVTSAAANGVYGEGAIIDILVNFSENVTVTGTPQLTLETGAIDQQASYFSGSGTSTLVFRYTVQAGDFSGDLGYVSSTALGLNGGAIKAADGKNANLFLAAPGTAGSLNANKNIAIDAISTTVSSVAVPANGTYKIGDQLIFTVNFSNTVTVTGTPQLALTLGSTVVAANYVSGSGFTALTFSYTVASGDLDANGITVAAIALSGGTIKDGTGDAVLTLNGVGSTANVNVDGVVPTLGTVSISSDNASNTMAKVGNTITLAFTASETIATPVVSIAGHTVAATNASGNNWSATYTMASGDTEGNVPFSIAFSDVAGNAGTAVGATTNSSAVLFDKTSPSVTITSNAGVSGSTTAIRQVDVTVTFSEPVTGFILGDLAPSNAGISNFAGSGTTYTLKLTAGIPGNFGLNLVANIAQDAAGNGNTAATTYTLVYDPTPAISTTGSFSALTAVYGTPSAASSIGVSGTNISGGITATADTGFEVSKDGSSYAPSVTITGTGSVTGTVYVRLKDGAEAGSYNAVNVSLSSAGATTKNIGIPLSTVTPAALTIVASNVNKTYGQTLLGGTGSTAFSVLGLENGETVSSITIAYGNGASAADAVGIYSAQVTPSAPVGTISPANYIITYLKGNIVIAPATPVIVFAPLTAQTYGAPDFDPGASSGNTAVPISYSSSNTAVATIVSGKIHIVGAGTSTITASQVASANYNAAADVPQTLTVGKASQTITFVALAGKTFGDVPFTLNATGGASGNTITFTSSDTNVATVSGNTVTIVGAGTATITASQAGNANYNAATDVPQTLTVGKASQTITFAALAGKTFGDVPFTLNATGGASGNAITYSSSNTAVATVSGSTVTIVGAGTATITASQAGNANYNAATDVPQTLTVGKASQTIAFTALAGKTFGDAPFTLNATGGASGNAVTYSSSNTAVATVSGSTVTIVGAGTATITASQAGNANYNAATDVPQTLTVGKASQTIAFAALAGKTFGDVPFTLNATGGASGNTITFTSSDTNIATVSGNMVTIVGAGTATITASQAGNANYNAATDVPQTLTVGKASQTIAFAALAGKTFGDAPFTLNATGGASGNAITFTSSDANIATVSGSTVTIVGAGTATITASQAGNANYSAATDVPQTLTVGKASQTITFATLAGKTFGDAPFTLNATGGASGNAITFTSSDTNVATVSGSTVTIVGAGTATITASQAGNANYNAATDVPQTLTVGKASQTITFATLAGKTFGDAPFTLNATGGASGNAITFTSSDTNVATVSGSTVTIVGAGTATITASQAGSANYNAATDVPQTLTVGKASQTITFAALAGKTFGNVPFTLNATGGASGNAITYSSSNTAVATVTGNTVTIVGAGTATITASQAGNANYNAATDVPQTLTVGKASQTITFAALAGKTFGDVPFTLNATGGASGNAITYSSSNTAVATVTGNTVTILGAGTATITASQAGNANYNAATDVPQTLTVGKASQTITFTALAGKTFGDVPFTLNATGGASGNAITYSSSNTAVATVTGNTVTIVGAGTATITASQAGNANYNAATDVPQTLTVGKASQTITFAALSNMIYGDAPLALTATGGTSGNAITYTSSNTNVATVTGNTLTIVGAGTATVTANQSGNANYNAASAASQGLTVTAKALTGSFTVANKAYDGNTAATITSRSLTGVLTADLSQVSLTGGNASFADANVGTGKPVTATGMALAGSRAGNYTLVSVAGTTAAITAKAITVVADAKSKTYGDADPALTYAVPGGSLVGTDALSGNLSRNSGNGAGTYAIIQGTLSAGANYSINYVGANLTINKKQLTITADNKNRLYNVANPALTVSYSGFVNSENSSVLTTQPTVSTTAMTTSPVGTYPITASGAAAANYAFVYVNGVLTINITSQTITFAALADKLSTDAPFALGATASSGLAVSYTSSDASIARIINGNQVEILKAGTVNITASQAGNGNYTAAVPVVRTLQIIDNPAPVITITSNVGSSISKGETAKLAATGAVTYQWSNANGIIAGQNSATLTVRPSVTTTYTVTGANQYGRTSIQSFVLEVRDDFQAIQATNILTPNGDGVNDKWIVENIDQYPNSEVKIFDKAGRVLYSKKGYDNSWDATLNGTPLNEGTYFYIIDFGAGKLKKKGFITIVRQGN